MTNPKKPTAQTHKKTTQSEDLAPEEFSCTFSTFSSIGCDIDMATLDNSNPGKKPPFSNRGKRLINFLYFCQTNEKLNGNTRAFLDQQTPPNQIKYYIPSLINTIVTTNNSIFKILSDLLLNKYRWLTASVIFLLAPTSVDIQSILFPEISTSASLALHIFISIILILLYSIACVFGFSHDKRIKEFSPALSDIESYSKAKVFTKEYLIQNYSILEKFIQNNPLQTPAKKNGYFLKALSFIKISTRNIFARLGLCLNQEDISAWIETATGMSIESLINEGKARKEKRPVLSKEEQLNKEINELKRNYEKKIKDLEERLSKVIVGSLGLTSARDLQLGVLKQCNIPIDDAAFPGVTVGLAIRTLCKENPRVTRAAVAIFMSALAISTKARPLDYNETGSKTCGDYHADQLRTTWTLLYEDDGKALLAYDQQFPKGLFSSSTLSSVLYADNPRSSPNATKKEEISPDCSFEDWCNRQSSKKS